MLTVLRIKNIALAADLALTLEPGLTAITGETGAGKSMVIGALNLALGARADRSLIRSGAESCSVEAVFDIRNLPHPITAFLEEHGLEPCEDHQLILRRSLTASGTNRQFINGSVTTLQTLAELGDWLVDMHGPHDHQSLLHPSRQLNILDAFANCQDRRAECSERFSELRNLNDEVKSFEVDDASLAQQLDLLRFQAREIAGAKLQPGEEEELEQLYSRASNSARLLELSKSAQELLTEQEGAVQSLHGAIGRITQEMARLDPAAAPLLELQSAISEQLQEFNNELSHYIDRIDIDPDQLSAMETRLNLIQSLKRKYGGTIERILEFGDTVTQKLSGLESREDKVAELTDRIAKVTADLDRIAHQLSGERKKAAPKLAKSVSKHLRDLGFKDANFDIQLREGSINGSGLDEIEFLFSPNVGEPAKPLRSIASSGEMARVMLALKTALATEDDIPVLVFDEVDANVGGVTAQAVGEKMSVISRNRQVLCITHLPQVAACATHHFRVEKQVTEGRTISIMERLDAAERIEELTRMLGGKSDAARKHAEALLSGAHP